MVVGVAAAIVGGWGPRGRSRRHAGTVMREEGAVLEIPIVVQRGPRQRRHGFGDPCAEGLGVNDGVGTGGGCHAVELTEFRLMIISKKNLAPQRTRCALGAATPTLHMHAPQCQALHTSPVTNGSRWRVARLGNTKAGSEM